MASSLESLLSEGVISEIYGRLKSGKEADVYAVCYGDAVVAAKVYKDRAQRNFKSNAAYKEGRAVRNTRSQRAMDRGSKFGQDTAEDAWKSAEATALYKLHAAGVRVPTPVMFLEGVLFMELVRGTDGEAAPRLIDTDLSPEQARVAYLDMLSQLVRILSCDLIHGDLSPYNVLWAAGGATIIDFPQIISAAQNSNSESFFMRDARNILGHFAAIDRSLQGRLNGDTREIWRAYVRRELSPEFVPSGRAPAPEPRPRFADEPSRAARPAPQDRGPRPSLQSRVPQQPQRGQQQQQQQQPQRGQQQQQPQRGQQQQPQRGQQQQPQQRGPQHDHGSHQNRGPQPNHNSRHVPQQSGTRPVVDSDQNRNGPGARLQMASARANIASQSKPNSPSRRPQRGAQRGPEVIVLTRRAPEGSAPPVERSEQAEQGTRDNNASGRRRR